MTITRRGFLSASAAFAAMPVIGGRAWGAPLPREADIVVIGAGAAGIAAARRIMAANRKVLVVEAANQIGGRCITDSSTLRRAVRSRRALDAQSRHQPDDQAGAQRRAWRSRPRRSGQKIRIGRRNARAGETEEFLATLVRANRAIDEASRKFDASCASALPKDLGDWAGTAEFVLGASFAGKDLKDFSADRQGSRAGPQRRFRLSPGPGHPDRQARASRCRSRCRRLPRRIAWTIATSRWKRPRAGSPRAPPSSPSRPMC